VGAVITFAGIVHKTGSVVPWCGTFWANSVSEAGSHGYIIGSAGTEDGKRNFPLAMNKDPLDC